MARSWEAAAPASKIQAPTDEHGEDEPMFAMFTHLHDPMTGSASGTVAETGTGTKSIGPTPAVPVSVAADDDDDDEALPIPISLREFRPCKITSADGRSETIYAPIPGFEHLFKPQTASHRRAGLSSPTALQPPSHVQPAAPPAVPPPSRNYSQRLQRPEQRTRKKDGPRKRAAPSPSKRRAQKRPHTATGTRDRATLVRDSSEDDEDEDERCADKAAATSTGPTAFLTSDFEGLKTFLRMRLEELTMKPLRPIVTEWVKLLVPRRQALYGPYHKRHPDTDAPADPAPHWWPTGIQYIEPSHLPKTGVLDLAVDLILQHRDSDIDQVKRRSGWTSIMRREAEYQVTKTAKEMFSSSKDPGFSESMKARALNHVLPEMFDVVQSYEDYVAQNSVALLNGPNATLPKGKKHTYLPVPRPKQPLPRKRVRIEQAVPATIKDEPRDESGSETEVDERMERVTRHYLRRQERAQAQATTPETPAAAAHKVETRSPTETPIAYTTPAGFKLDEHTATASCTSSFNQSMNELQLSDAKGSGGFAEVDYGYTSEMYHQPMQDASMFSNACQSQFHPNPAQVLGTGPFPLYNSYPLHSGTSSFGSSLAVAPGFTYERNGVFSPAPSGAAVLPTTNSFNGLPYDFDVNHQGPSLYYNGTQFAGQPCGDQ